MKTRTTESSLALSNTATLAKLLDAQQAKLAQALASTGIDAGRFMRMCMTAFREAPALAECDPASVLGCAMTSALMGLEPGAAFGQSYWVPFKAKNGKKYAQHITGYKGMLQHVYRSGLTSPVNSGVVYEGDEFVYERGLAPVLRHVEKATDKSDDKLTHAWACTTVGGQPIFEVMDRAALMSIWNRSKAKDSGPWVTDLAQMCRKTVIRRLCNYLPKQAVSTALMTQLRKEDGVEFGGVDPADLAPADITVEPHGPPSGEAAAQSAPSAPPAQPPDPSKVEQARAHAARLLATLSPDVSDRILYNEGIDNLQNCTDYEAMTRAIAAAETFMTQGA